jgi:hypothetical protein
MVLVKILEAEFNFHYEKQCIRTAQKYELCTEMWDNYLYKMLEAYITYVSTLRTGIFFLYIYHRSLNRSEDKFL